MRYLYIREIADLLGVSRDAIRIYEEQGLISPERDENGFRRYTEEDLERLIPVKFYRENAFPMKDLKRLMIQKTRLSSLELLEEQIKAERLELLRHKRNVERLELARSYYQLGSGSFELCTAENAYRVSEKRKEYFDAIIDWFQVSREDSDKIVCYVNAEYDLKMSVEQPQWCYLIIKESEAVYLRRQDFMEGAELLPGGPALRATVHTERQFPDEKLLETACGWADSHGLRLQGSVHVRNLCISEENGQLKYTLEVVLPLTDGPDTAVISN